MITVYSKDDCPYCVNAKQALKDCSVEHQVLNLNIDYDLTDVSERVFKATDGHREFKTYPAVFVGNEFIGGCDDLLDHLLENHVS